MNKIKSLQKLFPIAIVLLLSTASMFAQDKDTDAVKAVLKQCNTAIEKLDVTGTEKLFTSDSKVYESVVMKEAMLTT
jgi:hypothetical protein